MSKKQMWRSCLLGDVIKESTVRCGKGATSGVPVYGVDRQVGLTPNAKYLSSSLERYKRIAPGMFAYNPMRLNIGSIGFCSKRHLHGLVSPDYVVFSCDEKEILPEYLYLLTECASWKSWAESAGVGSVRVRIYYRELATQSVCLPPVEEQKAIVDILGALDDKIELNRKMNETQEAMAQALFKSWFVDFDPVIDNARAAGSPIPEELAEKAERRAKLRPALGEIFSNVRKKFPDSFQPSELGPIPRGWDVSTIGNQVTIKGGGTPRTKNPEFWDGGVHHWATPKDMSKLTNFILLDTDRKITDAGVQSISSKQLPEGTVLMSSRAPVGYLAISKIPISINQGFIAMVCDKALPNTYVLQWANSIMDEIKQRASGTTFAEISKKNFRPIPVLVPSGDVLAEYNKTASDLYDRITRNVEQNRTLSDLRDTLLPKLLSGELEIPEAEKMVEGVA
ncbi:restriction endonuclease subunit S [Tichowtungia aerotolerans]|uniref:Restriction endonuclease subunit S n=1 Tax=Tichowtungia aerotolerans TaxID=2697043 RepID=A0A6P1MCG3_9BACT|nr:restriction endonuclease subunit S [Tichowtungia aerotolerans]QHI68775.1 restriction endonuclease subunit S [Tichowtungia aerotolerans]